MYTSFFPPEKKGRFTVNFYEAVLVHVLLILLGTEWFRMFVREFHLNVLLARNKLEWIFWIHPLRKYTPVQFHSIAACRQLKAITTLETEEHLRIHYIPFSRFSSSTKFLEKEEEEEHKNTPAVVSPRREILPFDLHTRSEAPLWHTRIATREYFISLDNYMRSLIGVHCLGGSFLEGTVVLLTQRVAVDSQVTLHSVTS